MIDKLSYELRNNFDRIRDESLSIVEECEKKKIKIIIIKPGSSERDNSPISSSIFNLVFMKVN